MVIENLVPDMGNVGKKPVPEEKVVLDYTYFTNTRKNQTSTKWWLKN
jgi:hypothetical protein